MSSTKQRVALQIVLLGSCVAEYEEPMRRAEQERPDHFRGWVGSSTQFPTESWLTVANDPRQSCFLLVII